MVSRVKKSLPNNGKISLSESHPLKVIFKVYFCQREKKKSLLILQLITDQPISGLKHQKIRCINSLTLRYILDFLIGCTILENIRKPELSNEYF
jgi:hypothetical protein